MAYKKVLLIGGSGFIGTHLCKALAGSGKEITLLSKNTNKIKKLEFSGKIKSPEWKQQHSFDESLGKTIKGYTNNKKWWIPEVKN